MNLIDNSKVIYKKNLAIIGAYPNTNESLQILKNTILSLADEFDILLSTHYPVDGDIQRMVKYYIYDYRNETIPYESEYYIWWLSESNFYLQNLEKREFPNYHYAVYRLIMNGLNLIKDYYEDFYYINYDCTFEKSDLEKLKNLKINTLIDGKSSCFFARDDNFFDAMVFWSKIDYFLKVIPNLKTNEEFINITNGNNCFEHFVGNSYLKYDSFLNINRLLNVHPINYFSNSRIGQSSISAGKTLNPECRTILVKDINSDNIFFVYSNNVNKISSYDIEIKIDGIVILKIDSATSQTIFVQIFPKTDKIKMEVNDFCKEYMVDDIMNNTQSFIKFY